MGYPLDYAGPREIGQEIARLAPALAVKGESRHPGQVIPSVLAGYVGGGYAAEIERRFALGAAPGPSAEYPFQLTITRSLFRSGALTARSEALEKAPYQGLLLMHPDDAVRLGAADGARARVRSRLGAASVGIRVSAKARPGQVLFPEHYADAIRDLATVEVNPVTRVPVFVSAAVAVEIER
jgi:predicted molibdopterin-dependent oxidoreductase YjgC